MFTCFGLYTHAPLWVLHLNNKTKTDVLQLLHSPKKWHLISADRVLHHSLLAVQMYTQIKFSPNPVSLVKGVRTLSVWIVISFYFFFPSLSQRFPCKQLLYISLFSLSLLKCRKKYSCPQLWSYSLLHNYPILTFWVMSPFCQSTILQSFPSTMTYLSEIIQYHPQCVEWHQSLNNKRSSCRNSVMWWIEYRVLNQGKEDSHLAIKEK